MNINEDQEIFLKTRGIFCKVLKILPEKIQQSSLVMDDLGADSVELWDVAVGLERAFGVKFEHADMEKISTVDSIVDLIKSKSSGD